MNIRTIFLFFLAVIGSAATASTLESIVVKNEISKTSVLCSLYGTSTSKVFLLPNPERVVIDFDQTMTKLDVKGIALGNGLIAHLRSGRLNAHTLRLVFEMKQEVSISTTRSPNGLRVDMSARTGARGLKKNVLQSHSGFSKVHKTNVNLKNTSHTPTHVQREPPKKFRDVIVVLDPGHGGNDPGAIGPERVAEKKVVLAIALNLKDKINKQPGMRAVLTRNGDYYVGLRERLNIARHYNADVFISIHADAFINQHSSGVSVFALSPTGATSEAARWLAEKENYSELGGVNLSGLDDQTGVIRTVLLDLSQTATISASLKMGNKVLHQMGKIANLHNNGVEQARFVVLKSPDTPSVLIETGFITNPREEKNLSSTSYQSRLSQAIFDGLKSYFVEYPPHGTRLEAVSEVNLHIVRSGETLPSIAARYHVSASAIKSANHLSNAPLKAGQRLSIPSAFA